MAPLAALMRKRVFLLGFATAARISELHTLDIANLLQLYLWVCSWIFVARNQMPDQASWMHMVQALFYSE